MVVNSQTNFASPAFPSQMEIDYIRFYEAKIIAQDSTISEQKWMLDTLQSLISDSDIKRFLMKNIQNDTSRPHFNHVILEEQ